MGILDKFRKKEEKEKSKNPLDPENMGMFQRMAMKRIEKMSFEERNKLMQKMLTPENIQKNKKDILNMLDQLEKAGQMNKHQIFETKKRLGLL